VDEIDSKLAAGKSNSNVVAALLWALAAMVVVIVCTLLFTLFSDDTPDTAQDPTVVHPTHHDASPEMQKSQKAIPSGGQPPAAPPA
jgi:phosphomevalonate kinase